MVNNTLIEKFLKVNNFPEPNIKQVKDENIEIKLDHTNTYTLSINDGQKYNRWMTYDTINKFQGCQVYSHYKFAYGNCICTGLGFGIREQWLLRNKNVTSVTVIEKNQTIIDYHKKYNNNLLSKINVVCEDAESFTGKCDSLLLDHYEFETAHEILLSAEKIVKNIKCNIVWMWPLEVMLENISKHTGLSKYFLYNDIKTKHGLNLPNISKDELYNIINIYNGIVDNHEVKI